MLTRLAFDGFRSFPCRRLFDRGVPLQELELAPLTLVVGRNNAGKTSVLSLLHAALHALAGDGPSPMPLRLGDHDLADRFLDFLPGGDAMAKLELHLSLSHLRATHQLSARLFLEDALARDAAPSVATWTWDGAPFPAPRGPLQGSLIPAEVPERETLRVRARTLLAESAWLGPLRVPLAASAGSTARSGGIPPVGPRGEGVISLLRARQDLFASVSAWLSEHADLRLRWEVNLDQHQLVARRGRRGPEVSVAHTGAGIHQVLPVLTLAGLRALDDRGPFLDVLQQPELHLHDALQPALGDLFLDATASGEGVMVVETHAEGLLLRIRRRIAEGRVDPARVALYYVDDAPEGSTLHRVGLLPDGEVNGWPDGVFLERYGEVRAIRRAQRELP